MIYNLIKYLRFILNHNFYLKILKRKIDLSNRLKVKKSQVQILLQILVLCKKKKIVHLDKYIYMIYLLMKESKFLCKFNRDTFKLVLI